MTSDIKRIDIAEFRRLGFLQEVNRRFLHPCGLALEVVNNDNGTVTLGGVWDYRDDPEGIVFNDLTDDENREKAANVQAEWHRHVEARKAILNGQVVQPIGDRRA